MQLEDQLRAARLIWGGMAAGDRATVLSALGVWLGVLLPWISVGEGPAQTGLVVGGAVHLGLATLAYWVGTRRYRAAPAGIRRSTREKDIEDKRDGLWLVLIGTASTFFGAYLFLTWGLQKSGAYPIAIHWPVYWTLVCGTGLSYGGFARFR